MKEYKTVNDLPKSLKNEIEENKSFFDNFDGKSLDEQQRIACVLNDCDLEIIAGAGTGKTHTLLAKAAYLIEKKNIAPNEILFLSFSKSCVEELIERLNYNVPTSTIHAFGLSLIDEYREKEIFDGWGFRKIFDEYLEFASDKQISDIKDYCMENLKSEDMIKLIELDTEVEKFNHMVSKSRISSRIRSFIDLFKGKGYGISDFKKIKSKCKHEFETRQGNYYTEENYLKNMSFIQLVEPVYRFYESYLHRNHLIDFNDMINKAIELIENEGISDNFRYIFVDEYQDMSYKNFQFIKALKEACNANLVVVGDDWQSIYGFRDSDISLFNDFCDYFPNANRVFIEKTYRNPQELIDIAGKFIMKNDSQFKKSLKSDKSIDKPVKIVYDNNPESINNLINNLSKDSERVFILGRHNGDINDFIFDTDLVIKSKKEYKQITNNYKNLNNVEYRTVHKAKGLEADYVVLINVFDQQVGFPNKLYPPYFMNLMHDWDYGKKLEEERRLFYVAITRAKKGVYIFTKDYKQSEYVDELIEDNDLDLIYDVNLNEYKEFGEVKTKNIIRSNKTSQIVDSFDFVNSSDIEIKANLKDLGNKLMKSKDYDEAEDFYKKLITNKFFLNDYYPYRKLVEVYRKKKESSNIVKTIDEFFKSEVYCNNAQLLWFKLEFRSACRYTNANFSQFNEYLEYFNEHGINNIGKQNDPVPIAARIKSESRVISQVSHDLKSEEEELNLNYKFARKYESSQKALYYFEQLWQQEGFNHNLTAYKRLCSFYYDTGQYEKVIEVANEYFASDARRTKTSPDWFKRKIKKAEEMLSVKNDYSTNEITDDFKLKSNNEILNTSNEVKTENFKLKNVSVYSREYFNKLAKEIQSNPDFVSDREISQHVENDFIEISSNYDKINQKADLINQGRELEKEDKQEAIKFYDSLKTNELFVHDYYPYRRQCILFKNKIKDDFKDLDTVIELFNHEIYCNPHQYIWLHNKLLELIDKLNLSDYEIHKIDNLLKNYGENEEKYHKLQNTPVPIADRIFKDENGLRLLSQEKYDFVQDVYYINELGVGYIRRGEYETAISYYLNLLENDVLYYQYHAYKQLGRICKEMNNPDEFKILYKKLSNE
ncbi:MAG: helicase [Methanobrevibacter millerae]|uniref:DNA 3'-5' helicase n=1 Tax=Methanobrevibacter millerae TaxID=230361 RepID=A0A8T3VIG6_9EURY|nr:helicase [Methanobrevibacter millerae]